MPGGKLPQEGLTLHGLCPKIETACLPVTSVVTSSLVWVLIGEGVSPMGGKYREMLKEKGP